MIHIVWRRLSAHEHSGDRGLAEIIPVELRLVRFELFINIFIFCLLVKIERMFCAIVHIDIY